MKFNKVHKQKKKNYANEGEEKINFFKNCIFKEKSGNTIVEMHYIGHSII
jgi:hypothetical protein